jgi:hypothetical protein
MTNHRGPVVVGMEVAAADTPSATAALDLAAREALGRRVDLRLVYGQDALPPWLLACQILDQAVARLSTAYPDLAIIAAIYPGTSANALVAASATASLVVLAAEMRLDDPDLITSLGTATALTRAPVIMVVIPEIAAERREVPVLTG